jgi:hypothetical protein
MIFLPSVPGQLIRTLRCMLGSTFLGMKFGVGTKFWFEVDAVLHEVIQNDSQKERGLTLAMVLVEDHSPKPDCAKQGSDREAQVTYTAQENQTQAQPAIAYLSVRIE